MLHDCGILTQSKIGDEIGRIRSPVYLSPEARHSLRVLLSTPGFTIRFFARALRYSKGCIYAELARFTQSDYRSEAIANWGSITREDAIALCRIAGKGKERPVICSVYMVEDIQSGKQWQRTADLWGVDDMTIYRALKQTPFVFRAKALPHWFFELVPT